MKKFLLLPALLGWAHLAAAQHAEVIGRAGFNLSCLVGSSTGGTSGVSIYGRDWNGVTITDSPYGSRLGLGGGLGGRLLHESRYPLLLVLDLGYDYQRARTTITTVNYVNVDARTYQLYAADGNSYYKTQHLELFAALGYRLRLGGCRLDLLAGPELATIFGRREAGQGTFDNSHTWTNDVDRSGGPALDVRLRADLTAWRGRLGLNAGYAWGTTNYLMSTPGNSPQQAYDRSLRLGLAYRLSTRAPR